MADAVVSTHGKQRTTRALAPVVVPEERVRSIARRRSILLLATFDLVAFAAAWALLQPTATGVVFGLNLAALLYLSDAYSLPLQLNAWRHATRLMSRAALALFLPVPLVAVMLLPVPASASGDTQGLLWLAMATWAGVQLGREISYGIMQRLRASSEWRESAVIIGAGDVAQELASILADYPQYGLKVLGALDEVPGTRQLPVLGPPEMLGKLIRERQITRVLLAFGTRRDQSVIEVVRTAARFGVDVEAVPRFYEAGSSPDRPEFEQVRGISLYRLHRAAPHTRSWRAKRLFDIAVSAGMLVATAPVLLALAVAVRLSSPGPVLFRQTRIGQHGRPFELLKFRSMRQNSDSDRTWNVADDDRVTAIGKILRRTSLDELPQLWNVLRGDMGVVGPRPERPAFVDQFSEEVEGYVHRHRLPVGLTGYAQVEDARGDTPISERARLDNHYIDHWSLWRDTRIMLDTARVVVNDILSSDKHR